MFIILSLFLSWKMHFYRIKDPSKVVSNSCQLDKSKSVRLRTKTFSKNTNVKPFNILSNLGPNYWRGPHTTLPSTPQWPARPKHCKSSDRAMSPCASTSAPQCQSPPDSSAYPLRCVQLPSQV